MAKMSRPKRRKVGAKRLDLSDFRAALRDRRVWTGVGVVYKPSGESQHYEIVSESGTNVDVLVDVLLKPNDLDITCRLGAPGGGPAAGLWAIPPEGSEVVVILPEGELDFMPVIVATLSTGEIPDGVAPNVTVIANGEVLIHDGNGGSEPLVTKSEFDAHVHGTGTGPSGIPSNSPITGTTVLKAK